jgi:hypothetical protein
MIGHRIIGDAVIGHFLFGLVAELVILARLHLGFALVVPNYYQFRIAIAKAHGPPFLPGSNA